ncbi:uncharacterized protein DUF2769 [Herbihabitans rhizosphaerae]|uniref:Uncharacterized protein DUF2769 n=1 Tax=Herbihabitans rhizosphaerae TaxID=1872711 RepID=A0A4Q7L4W1_9PSEU|nr:RGCVC family protein [Herbihabitans rhizosphaerae]RZS43820.1 uncharacterized protein DUF2769 [Herbihabitans rhizosphaerae]
MTQSVTMPTDRTMIAGAVCPACPHYWATHDKISARFCAATLARKHERGCVCPATTELAESIDPGQTTS